MTRELAKQRVGEKAAELIENGQIVGLGTGSTADCFIDALIERAKRGLKIRAVPSSHASSQRAERGGIEILDINSAPRIDVTVDGADEIDPKKRMIKGRGGAHVREKILASASEEMIVIVDETKLVPRLGSGPLPVEVLFYGSPATRQKIEDLGFTGQWRMNDDGTLFISENGNLLFDISFESPIADPEEEHFELIQIPGVVDTGFFFGLAGRVLVGYGDGSVQVRN